MPRNKGDVGSGIDWRAMSSQVIGLLNLIVITESSLEAIATASYAVRPVLSSAPQRRTWKVVTISHCPF